MAVRDDQLVRKDQIGQPIEDDEFLNKALELKHGKIVLIIFVRKLVVMANIFALCWG